MRPIWTGSISFGLVNVPVKLYLAAKSERFSFRMLHGKDQSPVHFKRFCEAEDREVPYGELVRGYEYEKGQFVVIEDEDFERIERPAARSVEIQQFVDGSQINPMLFDTPYFLEPTRGADKAYALLREALRRSGKVGIAKVALKEREYIAAVHVVDSALVMSTLRYAAEIREAKSLELPAEGEKVADRQVELAMMLVDQLSGDFEPQTYSDSQHAQMAEIIRQKLEGLPIPERAPERPAASQVVDLADILERSIRQAKDARQQDEGQRRAPRQLAARSARTPRTSRSSHKTDAPNGGTKSKSKRRHGDES